MHACLGLSLDNYNSFLSVDPRLRQPDRTDHGVHRKIVCWHFRPHWVRCLLTVPPLPAQNLLHITCKSNYDYQCPRHAQEQLS